MSARPPQKNLRLIDGTPVKRCARCKESKPLTEFSGSKRKDSYCRPCKAAGMRESRVRLAARGLDQATIVRFWRRVKKGVPGPLPTPCWIWQGKPKADGYGQFWVAGKVKYAHRVALDLLGMVIPDGMDADHLCRNRLCVSPFHLRAATERQNALENNSSPHAKNAAKTECVHGHPFTPENTVVHPTTRKNRYGKMVTSNVRICVACWKLNHPKAKVLRGRAL